MFHFARHAPSVNMQILVYTVLIPTSFLTLSLLHNFFHKYGTSDFHPSQCSLPLPNLDVPMSLFEPRPIQVSSLRNLEIHSSSKFFHNLKNLFERNSVHSLLIVVALPSGHCDEQQIWHSTTAAQGLIAINAQWLQSKPLPFISWSLTAL